jgi:hypothetical protein
VGDVDNQFRWLCYRGINSGRRHFQGKATPMSDLWVAVTTEYRGTTFSHRAGCGLTTEGLAVHYYNCELDTAASIVRRGLAGWLPPQNELRLERPLADHEKIAAIRDAMDNDSLGYEGAIAVIEKILAL